jgi:putative membrane protein
MKTPIKNYIAGATILVVAALSACTNTKTNNASYAADSANKAKIDTIDSAKIDSIAQVDSNNKKAEKKAYEAIKEKRKLKEDETGFLVKSYESGLYEIELAELAASHAANAGVKQLATQLITAHKASDAQMLTIAFNATYKLPGGIDSEHAKDLNNLDKLKGKDFDKKFIDEVIDTHQKSVDAYSDASKKLAEGETRSYAAQTLPKIQGHLAMAKKLKDRLK